MANEIIKKLYEKNPVNLLDDIQVNKLQFFPSFFLKSHKNALLEILLSSEEKLDCGKICNVLKALFQYISPSSVDPSSQQVVFDMLPCINLCIDYLKHTFKPADLLQHQFYSILYHLIRSYLKVELFHPALSSGRILRELLADPSNSFDQKSTYFLNLAVIFWNEAYRIENKPDIPVASLPNKLRIISAEFQFLLGKDYNALSKRTESFLQVYCQKYFQTDLEEISDDLKNLWSLLKGFSYNPDHQASLYSSWCTWFCIVSKRSTKASCIQFLLSLLGDVSVQPRQNDKTILGTCSAVARTCIQFFLLKEYEQSTPKHVMALLDVCKNRKHLSDIEVQIFSRTCDVMCICFTKHFKSTKANSDSAVSATESRLEFCILVARCCLEMSSKEELNQLVSLTPSLKIYFFQNLASLFVVHFKKAENGRQKNLIKKFKEFIFFSQSNLSSLTEQDEFSNGLIAYGSYIIHLGFSVYNAGFLSDSIAFLEAGESLLANFSSTDEYNSAQVQQTLWRMNEVFVYASFMSGKFDVALLTVAKSLLSFKTRMKECFELWRKIKKEAMRKKKDDILLKTLSDLWSQTELNVDPEHKITFLLEELKICKIHFEAEAVVVINELLSLNLPKSSRAFVLFEVITMPPITSDKITTALKKSLPELCLESINLYNDHLIQHPEDDSAKLCMSLMYFWLYHENTKTLHEIATKEAEKILAAVPKPKKNTTSDVGEENEICDIQPTHPLVCLSIEEEALKNLDLALKLWESISDWKSVQTLAEENNLLTIIQATAETYAFTVCDSKELKLWLLLQKISDALGSNIHKFTAYLSLAHAVTRLGYLNLASSILKIAETTCEKLTNLNYELAVIRLKLAKSNHCMHTGQFAEGLNLVEEVLSSDSMKKPFKSFKILNVEALMLYCEYLCLPTKAFTEDSYPAGKKNSFYLASAMEAVSLTKSLLRHFLDKTSSSNGLDWLCFKPLLLRHLLKAHLSLGEMYFKAGEPRYARVYLQEALIIAESHFSTYWSAKVLIALGHIDLVCENFKDCEVKASGLRYILGNKKRNMLEIISELQAKHASSAVEGPTSPVSPASLVLYTVPDITVTRHIKQTFFENVDVMSSPVSSKLSKKKNNQLCLDSSAEDNFFRNLLQLEFSFLDSSRLQLESQSIEEADIVWQRLLVSCQEQKIPDYLRSVLTSVKFVEGSVKDVFSRVRSKSETLLFTSIAAKLVRVHCSKNEALKARNVLNSAYAFLKKSFKCPNLLYPEIYSLLRYHDIRLSLCKHLKISTNASVSFHLCPSVKSSMPVSKSVEKPLSEITFNTPVSKNVPKLIVTKHKKCNAPLKKSILNTEMKKDIKLLPDNSEQHCSPFMFFSSSDEEENFQSPLESFSRASKSKSRLKKVSEKKTKKSDPDYKVFKSKNSNTLGVKSASDIWSLSLADTPKNSKVGSRKLKQKETERKLSIENARSSPLGKGQRKKTASKNSQKDALTVPDDLASDSVFFSPCKGSSQGQLPDLVETLCDDLKRLDLKEAEDTPLISKENLKEIIEELRQLRLLIHNSMPFPLYADLCKLLAVLELLNPASSEKEKKIQCSFFLSETFSVSLRNIHVANMVYLQEPEIQIERDTVLASLQQAESDINLEIGSFLKVLPENWAVIQVSALQDQEFLKSSAPAPCPSKLMFCRFQKDQEPVIIGTDCNVDDKISWVSSNFFNEFETILKESTLTLNTKDSKAWWNTRMSLNTRLQDLVKCMENFWLGCWKGILLGEPQSEERIRLLKSSVEEISKASPCSQKLLQILIDSAQYLSKDEILAAVNSLWSNSLDVKRLQALCKTIKSISVALPKTERHHVIFILDQSVQALPWECMPVLGESSISRMPSLSILHYKLALLSANSLLDRGIDTCSTYYLLNPGGDLLKSQECFQKKFEKQKKWNGKTGIAPSVKEYISAFKDHELFIYCGHGSGRQYFESACVEKMRLQAVSVLMGCSSGRLRRLGKILEANGYVLKLLLSGCLSITANLWDVTDRDIDRFTDRLLQSVVPDYEGESAGKCSLHNVAKGVSVSRSACRLKYLVGAAPVVYGFPVSAKK